MIVEPRPETQFEQWPMFHEVRISEDGQALVILVREADGSISAVRVSIEQVAD